MAKKPRVQGRSSGPEDRDRVRSAIVDAIRAEIARGLSVAAGDFTKDVYTKEGHEKGAGNPFYKDVYSKDGHSKGVSHDKGVSPPSETEIPGVPGGGGGPTVGQPGSGRTIPGGLTPSQPSRGPSVRGGGRNPRRNPR